MYDICCIGHITLDKIINGGGVVHMAGGTSVYFSNAIRNMNVRYSLVTSLAMEEMHFVSDLREKGIDVKIAAVSPHTVYFENNYLQGPDLRTQRILQRSEPFELAQLADIESRIFHLGPLLSDDIPVDIIKALSQRAKLSLDIQGYLRGVDHKKVFLSDWTQKFEALPCIDFLKANEYEMQALTGSGDVRRAAIMLSEWGVKEIIITLGSRGSVIYNGNRFYDIPAYHPLTQVVDATGCGDTYMAGYLFQRLLGTGYQHAGEFAAAMATLKIESSGPFTGNPKDVYSLLRNSRRKIYLEL